MRYILVHGSCHGAWCWRDVVPLLDGHDVVAIDLPSHGPDTTPIADVTLQTYVDAVVKVLDASEEPAVLVGHSAAGITISSVAEARPEKVAKLIYLCAYAPEDGDDLVSMRKRAKRQLLLHAVKRSEDGLSFTADLSLAGGLFYHDCPPESVAYALPKLCPQAILPQVTAVKLGANYACVPRAYILCEDDHTIPPEAQEEMVARWPTSDVYRLDSGHSPFFSQPQELAKLLLEIPS